MRVVFFLFTVTLYLHINFCTAITNVDVLRNINLQNQVTTVKCEIKAEIDGSEYEYVIDNGQSKHLAYITASSDGKKLSVIADLRSPTNTVYKIVLPKSATKTVHFVVTTIFTQVLTPRPNEITQAEKQYVKYTGNLLFYSKYDTLKQKTVVTLPKGEILAYTNTEKPFEKLSEGISYGPYNKKPPLSFIPLDIHFESKAPFLKVTSLTRHIEVSHWGNIAVEETIDMVHWGAKLRGPFSRFDLQRGIGRHASVESFITMLPASAKDIYYRDDIGNISTSAVHDRFNTLEIELRPRFPLFGGWKTKYMLGYNVPAHEYLYRKGAFFALKMRFVDHIYDSQHVDDMTLKIVLPEAVSNVEFKPPFEVASESREILKTYLDTYGRTVVVAKKENVVGEHIQDFVLYYQFNMASMVREPLMVVVAFLLVFVVAVICVRLDFSIHKDLANESRLRTQAVIDEVQNIQERRTSYYQAFEDIIGRYRAHKDHARLTTDRKKIESDLKNVMHQLTELQSKLSECWSEGAEKINELQNLATRYRKHVQDSFELVNRLVNEKISRQQYQTQNEEISAKKHELMERMTLLIDNM